MNISQLSHKLLHLISLENKNTHEEIAGFIVGELIGDYENKYETLLEDNPSVRKIADIASDLEWSNGSQEQLDKMWLDLKNLINSLK